MNVTPLEKLHKDAVFATVFMFLFLSWLVPQIKAWVGGSPASADLLRLGIAALAVSLGSRPVYGVIANLLVSMARSQVWLKRRYLGRGFLHGTWFGLIRTKRGHLRVFVEQFDQELDNLTIRGVAFSLSGPVAKLDRAASGNRFEGSEHLFPQDATWLTRATDVNPRAGELYCFYDNNVVRKHYDVKAVGHFIIDYGPDNVPVELKGYAIDVDAGIELIQEFFREVRSGEALALFPEEITKVRLSYDRVVKVRRDGWFFKRWPFKYFSDRVLTFEAAKPLAISFFAREIEEEIQRLQGDAPPATTSG